MGRYSEWIGFGVRTYQEELSAAYAALPFFEEMHEETLKCSRSVVGKVGAEV